MLLDVFFIIFLLFDDYVLFAVHFLPYSEIHVCISRLLVLVVKAFEIQILFLRNSSVNVLSHQPVVIIYNISPCTFRGHTFVHFYILLGGGALLLPLHYLPSAANVNSFFPFSGFTSSAWKSITSTKMRCNRSPFAYLHVILVGPPVLTSSGQPNVTAYPKVSLSSSGVEIIKQ
jgi:hypothetical protein